MSNHRFLSLVLKNPEKYFTITYNIKNIKFIILYLYTEKQAIVQTMHINIVLIKQTVYRLEYQVKQIFNKNRIYLINPGIAYSS